MRQMQAEHGVDLREMLVLLLVYLQVIERDILGLDETDYRADMPDDDILKRLLALNLARSATISGNNPAQTP